MLRDRSLSVLAVRRCPAVAFFALLLATGAIMAGSVWADEPAVAEKPQSPPAAKTAEAIRPSDHVARIGVDGRPAVMAYRMKNFVDFAMKVGDGYVDGGHAMKIHGDDRVSSSREILTVDRGRDATLQQELAYARSEELSKLNTFDRATRLARHVAKMYTPEEGRKKSEEKCEILDSAHGNREVLIGDVAKITGGAGVCRHRSLMFKLLADEAGLKVAIVRGRYGRDLAKAGYHAWNELKLDDGSTAIVDIMNPQPDFHFPALNSKQAGRYYTGDRKPMYENGKSAAQEKLANEAKATSAQPAATN